MAFKFTIIIFKKKNLRTANNLLRLFDLNNLMEFIEYLNPIQYIIIME